MDNRNESVIVENSVILLCDIQKLSREEQKEIMRAWFLENFENPVERTPYESREGGYIYMGGSL